jgi:hypothetical protein
MDDDSMNNLIIFRDCVNEIVEHLLGGRPKAELNKEMGDKMLVAVESLVDKYGDNFEGITIPDGFFDGLGQKARVMALVGLLEAILEDTRVNNE